MTAAFGPAPLDADGGKFWSKRDAEAFVRALERHGWTLAGLFHAVNAAMGAVCLWPCSSCDTLSMGGQE